ncbi:hypothetical protein CKY10_03615 [Photorhabdus sp. HUG-39]|nr:hypothetical protein CKY10_03615 [Photorhabdus sp. HUG-39]
MHRDGKGVNPREHSKLFHTHINHLKNGNVTLTLNSYFAGNKILFKILPEAIHYHFPPNITCYPKKDK